MTTTQITIFYSYADKDERWQKELQTHLSAPKKNVMIKGLHHGDILGGAEWKNEVQAYIKQSQIILLLISPDFLAPEHYEGVEVQCIIELKFGKTGSSQIEDNETPRIIPILVRPTSLENTPFSSLKILPVLGEAISVSKDPDKALHDVAEEIKKVIEVLSPSEDDIWNNSAEEAKQIYKPVWKMPPEGYNPLFTGRERLLTQLHNKLVLQKKTALTQPQHKAIGQAISGLGGIGKTQIAIEYVYRYRKDYSYVFWVNADTREMLIREYAEIAQKLNLPEQNEQDQMLTVAAVMRWLETHGRWLLVLDNADDINMVQQEFVPGEINGHLLLTTRALALGSIAERIEIEQMDVEEGVLFLLRRATIIPVDGSIKSVSQVDREDAAKIVQVLAGLPLALDQAGAYIESTHDGLARYFQLYQTLGRELLEMRGTPVKTHPKSVVTTFVLAFEKVEQTDTVAANLLRLCAFLAADAIPESILTAYLGRFLVDMRNSVAHNQKSSSYSNPFARFLPNRNKQQSSLSPIENRSISPTELQYLLNKASEVLLNFSLIRRDQPSTFAVHRLVQAVLKDYMDKSMQREWAERAVHIVNDVFPTVEVNTWSDCEKILPQVLACAMLIDKYQITFPAASRLLNNAGFYLAQRAQYREAEPLYRQALTIREQMVGEQDPSLAQSLHNLAELYDRQGEYSQAEQLLKRALTIRKRLVGEDHPDTATSLSNLAELYKKQNKYKEAEVLYERALEINQKMLRPQHPTTSMSLNKLATLYLEQGKYLEAEYLYGQALEIIKRELGEDDHRTAAILHDLAELYRRQGKIEDAEKLHNKVLEIRKRVLGEENPDTATSLHSLAELYEDQGRTKEAEQFYQQALSIRKNKLTLNHPDSAATLSNLARLYRGQGRMKEAEQFYQQALLGRENKLGLNHPSTLENQKDLADLYESQGRFGEAERLYKRALANKYRNLRVNASSIMQDLRELARLYQRQKKTEKLKQLYEQAFEVNVQKLGIDGPFTLQHLHNLLGFYEKEGKVEETERLLGRVFKMFSQKLRGDNPSSIKNFQQSLENLTKLYKAPGKVEKVERLYEQALKTCYEKLGADDRLTIKCYNYLMKLYEERGKITHMEDLYTQEVWRRTQEIRKDDLYSIKRFQQSLQGLEDFYRERGEIEQVEKLHEQGLTTSYQKLGLDHPHTILRRNKLAELYESHGKPDEAERIYKEAVEICNMKLEPQSPHFIECRNDLVSFYLRRKNYDPAKPHINDMRQFIEPMLKEQPVPKHYTLAIVRTLANAASLYQHIYKREWKTTESWFKQALQLSQEQLGKNHQETIDIRQSYISFLKEMGYDAKAAAIEIDAITMEEADKKKDEEDEQSDGSKENEIPSEDDDTKSDEEET